MNTETPNSSSINESRRCQHQTTKNRQCRVSVVDPNSHFCWRHARSSFRQTGIPDLPALAAKLHKFDSAAQVHEFLSNVLVLFAQERIAARRASVFAYICNLLLRTLSSVQAEQQPALQNDEENFPRLNFEGVFAPVRKEPAHDANPAPASLATLSSR